MEVAQLIRFYCMNMMIILGIVGLRPPSCPCGCSCFVLGSGLVPLLFCRLCFVFGGETQIWLGDLRVVWCLDGCVALDCHSCHSLYSLNSRCVQCSLLFRLYQFQDRASELYRPHLGKKWRRGAMGGGSRQS